MILNLDTNKLSKLVESFYTLTKIRIVVYDNKFNEIFSFPEKHTAFCDMMNSIPEIHKKCNMSAKQLCELCRDKGEMVTFTCHAGLTEVAAPLCEDNLEIGYIMFGQITNIKDKSVFLQTVKEKCKNYNLNSEEFNQKAATIKHKTDEQMEAVSEIMNVFTSYIRLKKIVFAKKDEPLASIVEYINLNLSEDLSVPLLCKKFSISKTVLYNITKPIMPCGIGNYIKNKRIEKAKELLTATDKSVEEIADLVGFIDCDYFRRVFKQNAGISAKNYRKNAVKN
jgi:YesN/AraC family two-component response regulator